ncbi:MAG: tRNA pseudouridine(55) synthase TruB [Lachnospiraceae bacterium]|nr:tRNA pseudouridine(55) synthase TruB [Lachnospiraceae bacterium]
MSGVLNIYKEAHWTSFDVVAKIRGICHVKKIGHAGTLDPAAEGVLPVCVGKATRIADLLSGEIKTYCAQMRLGEETDTLDQTGTVVRRTDPAVLNRLTEGQVREVINSFVGGYDQVPPMYSARHVQGKRLYELAREGKSVERAAVPVRIDRIVIDEISIPNIALTVTCGRGTYIRSLCADIGEKLGCGAVMTHLVRTRVGPFEISDALTIGQVQERLAEKSFGDLLMPVDQVFAERPAVTVASSCEKLAYNGNKIPLAGFQADDLPAEDFRLYDSHGRFIGIFRIEGNGQTVKPVKMFYDLNTPDS